MDRQKIEAILARRFPGSTAHAVAAAANAIMGLDDEWEEIVDRDHYLGCHCASPCRGACYLAQELEDGSEFRLFRRLEADDGIPAAPASTSGLRGARPV